MITHSRIGTYVFHILVYDVVWLLLLATAGSSYSLTGCLIGIALVVLQILWQIIRKETSGLILIVVMFWITGLLGDGYLIHYQWLSFAKEAYFGWPWPAALAPLFMQILWVCFAVTFFCTLQFFRKHLVWLSLFSLFGFPLAYYLGAALGAATMTHNLSLVAIGLTYAIALPLTVLIYNRLRGSYD